MFMPGYKVSLEPPLKKKKSKEMETIARRNDGLNSLVALRISISQRWWPTLRVPGTQETGQDCYLSSEVPGQPGQHVRLEWEE